MYAATVFYCLEEDHLERLKEKEETTEKQVEATELLTSKIKIDVIAQNEDPKPRTVLFQGGEDDTTSFACSRTNDNDDVQATHQDQVIIAPLVTVNDVYVPNYTSVDKKYTEKIARLVEVTCMHTMVLAETHSFRKEKNKMLDVHALREERYMCVQPCMHKKLEALSYDGGANMARHVDGDNLEGFQFEYYEKIASHSFKRKRSSSNCILFLSLPCKEFAR